MKFREVKFSIIENEYEDELPTYYVLKSTYYFGCNMVGLLLGIDGSFVAFQELESAEQFKQLLCGKK